MAAFSTQSKKSFHLTYWQYVKQSGLKCTPRSVGYLYPLLKVQTFFLYLARIHLHATFSQPNLCAVHRANLSESRTEKTPSQFSFQATSQITWINCL